MLWLEGVDFSAHLYDTNDLSTQRGASLAYLHAADWAEKWLKDNGHSPKRILAGASKGVWEIAADDPKRVAEELLAKLRKEGADAETVWEEAKKAYDECRRNDQCTYPQPAPFAHLSFVCGWGENDNPEAAMAQAEARARAQQFRRFTLRPAGDASKECCPKDSMRPAQSIGFLPGETSDESAKKVSNSVKARRAYGRYARPGFYAGEAGEEWGKLFFVDHFEDMVKDPPEEIAESARGKIAVFYADGNAFSKLVGDDIEGRKAFSQKLQELQCEKLLVPLLKELDDFQSDGAARDLVSIAGDKEIGDNHQLRFETLLWGGDEVMFVMPSWLGLWFTSKFFEWTKEWESPDGRSLTFGTGLLICNYKTPIRVARKIVKDELAEAAADWGKRQKPMQSALCAFVMESVEPLENGLLAMRKQELNLDDKLEDALIIPGEKVDGVIGRAQELKECFPRSQLYRLLRRARADKLFTEGRTGKIRDMLDDWLKGAGSSSGLEFKDFMLVDDNDSCELGKRLPMNLLWLAELWDYLPPGALKGTAACADEEAV